MKQALEQLLEPLPGLWREGGGNGKPTKRPSSKRHSPLPSNSSRKKRKRRPHISRVSTHLNGVSPLVWTLADTPSNDTFKKRQTDLSGEWNRVQVSPVLTIFVLCL